jgi:hypothetical protein
MGCEVCSNKSEFYVENIQINNILKSKRNLNYLLENEIDFNEKKYSIESNVSSNIGNSTSNNNEKLSYLENMREEMFNEINLIRKNPQIIEQKIDKYLPFLTTLPKNSYIQIDKNNKIKLNTGKNAFESCKLLFSNKKSVQPLQLKKELTFPFPKSNNNSNVFNENFISENYISKTLKILKNNLLEKNIELVNFHYDIMNCNIELSVLLQIIDDTNYMFHRRNNIFSKSSKYIGINIEKISNGLFCYYLMFGKDMKNNN